MTLLYMYLGSIAFSVIIAKAVNIELKIKAKKMVI